MQLCTDSSQQLNRTWEMSLSFFPVYAHPSSTILFHPSIACLLDSSTWNLLSYYFWSSVVFSILAIDLMRLPKILARRLRISLNVAQSAFCGFQNGAIGGASKLIIKLMHLYHSPTGATTPGGDTVMSVTFRLAAFGESASSASCIYISESTRHFGSPNVDIILELPQQIWRMLTSQPIITLCFTLARLDSSYESSTRNLVLL